MSAVPAAFAPAAASTTRWVQLGLGLVAMMAISSPQYVWTLFTKPFGEITGASLAAIQVTFTIVIVLQTFFSPVQGYLIDRFSPKLMIALGTALSGLGWIMSAYATSLFIPVFAIVIVLDVLTGILALLVLKPMRARHALSA